MAQKPVKKIQLGSIRASIWENVGKSGKTWHNVVVTKSYKEDNEFKDTNSFGLDDLPMVSKAMDFAYAWIWNQRIKAEKKSRQSA